MERCCRHRLATAESVIPEFKEETRPADPSEGARQNLVPLPRRSSICLDDIPDPSSLSLSEVPSKSSLPELDPVLLDEGSETLTEDENMEPKILDASYELLEQEKKEKKAKSSARLKYDPETVEDTAAPEDNSRMPAPDAHSSAPPSNRQSSGQELFY